MIDQKNQREQAKQDRLSRSSEEDVYSSSSDSSGSFDHKPKAVSRRGAGDLRIVDSTMNRGGAQGGSPSSLPPQQLSSDTDAVSNTAPSSRNDPILFLSRVPFSAATTSTTTIGSSSAVEEQEQSELLLAESRTTSSWGPRLGSQQSSNTTASTTALLFRGDEQDDDAAAEDSSEAQKNDEEGGQQDGVPDLDQYDLSYLFDGMDHDESSTNNNNDAA